MSVMKNYEEFINNNNSKFSPEEGMNETRSMAKYNSDQFKEMFSQKVLESSGQIDNRLVEKLHSYYEINMLLESKSKWFNDIKECHYLDADERLILFKDSEAFVIERKTFDLMVSEEDWSDVESSGLIKEGFTLIKESWLGKAKEFGSRCLNFAKEMLKPKSTQEWIMLVISLLSAAAGIIGTMVPGFSIVSGVLMILNGGLHIHHGFHEFKHAKEIVSEVESLNPIEKSIAAYIKATPAAIAGALGVSMGVYDIAHSVTTLVNPAAGVNSAAAHHAAETTAKTIGGPGGFIHHLIEDVVKKISGNETIVKAVMGLTMGLLPVILHVVLSKFIPFFWNTVLAGADKLTKGFELMVNLPGKISEMIGKYYEYGMTKSRLNANHWIAAGLNKIVKPLTDKLKVFVEQSVNPSIQKVKDFISNQQKAAALLKQYPDLHHGEEKIKVQPIGKESLKPMIKDIPEQAPGDSKKDDPENKEAVEELKNILGDQEKKEVGGEENKEVGGEEKKEESINYKDKKYRYLVEFNKFQK
jgi:hypothetical protein